MAKFSELAIPVILPPLRLHTDTDVGTVISKNSTRLGEGISKVFMFPCVWGRGSPVAPDGSLSLSPGPPRRIHTPPSTSNPNILPLSSPRLRRPKSLIALLVNVGLSYSGTLRKAWWLGKCKNRALMHARGLLFSSAQPQRHLHKYIPTRACPYLTGE